MDLTKDRIAGYLRNSYYVAVELGYKKSRLQEVLDKLKIILKNNAVPNIYFGEVIQDKEQPKLIIYKKSKILDDSSNKITVKLVKIIGKEKFLGMFYQSCIDHELIGHLYYYFLGKDCSEKTALKTQLLFAEKRSFSDNDWTLFHKYLPLILRSHNKLKPKI